MTHGPQPAAQDLSGPPGPVADMRPAHWRRYCVLAVCAAVLCLRKPRLVTTPQLWAEDGGVFFADAWLHGWSSLTIPYAGYFSTIQRLVALLACEAGPALVPAVFVAASLVLTLWVAARILSSRFPLRPRIVCALAVVMVPEAGEVLLCLTNVQWVLAIGLLALLLSDDPRSRGQRTHDCTAAILLGLTGPFSLLFAPLFLWRAAVRRTRASSILAALVLLTAAVQLSSFGNLTGGDPAAAQQGLQAATAIGSRLGGRLLLGTLMPESPATLLSLVLAAITLAGAAWLACRRGPARRQRLLVGVAFLLLLLVSLYRCRFELAELQSPQHGTRYFFPLRVMLLWLVAALLHDEARRMRLFGALLLAVVLATNAGRLKEAPLKDLHWHDYVARIRDGEAVVIPINPPGWFVSLPGSK